MTVMRNFGFTKRAMLGPREQDRECTEREVGREVRSLKTRQRKRPGTSIGGKGKEETVETRKRPLSEEENEVENQ